MKDISLHIMDIIENSIRAGARNVWIELSLIVMRNKLKIIIRDDGRGMDETKLNRIDDPFYTTKEHRSKKVGLGIPLFKQNAEQCNGNFEIKSKLGEGTTLEAVFQYDHLDRMPLGNLKDTFLTAIVGHPETDFHLNLTREYLDGKKLGFKFSTQPIKFELGDIPLVYPDVIQYLDDALTEGIKEINLEEH